jgi:hypothetical protein
VNSCILLKFSESIFFLEILLKSSRIPGFLLDSYLGFVRTPVGIGGGVKSIAIMSILNIKVVSVLFPCFSHLSLSTHI